MHKILAVLAVALASLTLSCQTAADDSGVKAYPVEQPDLEVEEVGNEAPSSDTEVDGGFIEWVKEKYAHLKDEYQELKNSRESDDTSQQ